MESLRSLVHKFSKWDLIPQCVKFSTIKGVYKVSIDFYSPYF